MYSTTKSNRTKRIEPKARTSGSHVADPLRFKHQHTPNKLDNTKITKRCLNLSSWDSERNTASIQEGLQHAGANPSSAPGKKQMDLSPSESPCSHQGMQGVMPKISSFGDFIYPIPTALRVPISSRSLERASSNAHITVLEKHLDDGDARAAGSVVRVLRNSYCLRGALSRIDDSVWPLMETRLYWARRILVLAFAIEEERIFGHQGQSLVNLGLLSTAASKDEIEQISIIIIFLDHS